MRHENTTFKDCLICPCLAVKAGQPRGLKSCLERSPEKLSTAPLTVDPDRVGAPENEKRKNKNLWRSPLYFPSRRTE